MYINPKPKKKALDNNYGILHIDYDKTERTFYNNIYFRKYNLVLKMPLFRVNNDTSYDRIKIEKFDLTKYIYLLHY